MPDLISLSGLSSLQSVGGYMSIEFCRNLEAVNEGDLPNLQSIGDKLYIQFNQSLQTINGFEGLQQIGDHFILYNNHLLSGIQGFNSLEEVGSLVFAYDTALTDLSGLQNLHTVHRDFSLFHMSGLSNLNDFASLQNIGRDLQIVECHGLSNLNGLQSLEQIGRHLLLKDNLSLQSLYGLQTLQSVGGNFSIYRNPQLQSLQELESLQSIQGELRLLHNYQLSYCAIDAICNYLADPPALSWVGNNADSCRNEQQILDQCIVAVREAESASPTLSLHPNPTSSQLLLQIHLPKGAAKGSGTEGLLPYELSVYDLWGQLVMWEDEVWEIEHRLQLKELPAGSYLLVLRLPEASLVRRFVVIR